MEKTEEIYVIGNGPSLRGFDFHSLGNTDSIGMNVAFRHWHRIDWYPTYYTCLDTVMIETHKESIKDLIINFNDRIKLFFIRKRILDFYPELKNNSNIILFDDYLQSPYFSGISGLLTTGSFATLFVTMLGYRKIFLLGIDQNLIEQIPEAKHVQGHVLELFKTPKHNPNYFFDDYQKKGERYNIPNSTPNLHYKSWKTVKKRLEDYGVDVINCSHLSKLDIFDFKVIKKIKTKNSKDVIIKSDSLLPEHLEFNKSYKSERSDRNVYVITTLDEVGVKEYLRMHSSLRQNSINVKNLKIIVLYGETISTPSIKKLKNIVDVMQCFSEFQSYKYFDKKYGKKLFHPLGKLCKLFFMREFLEDCAKEKDIALFIDPDVIIQRPLNEFLSLIKENIVLFGHEVQLIHRPHSPNARLIKAELFDNCGPWQATYITEINTGINLSYVKSFCELIKIFENFVIKSEYFTKLKEIPNDYKWHDQDFFRYFYRKTMRLDIGVFDLDQVFTTTRGAAKCLTFDNSKNKYVTAWDRVPFMIHFAGGTFEKVHVIRDKNISQLQLSSSSTHSKKNDRYSVSLKDIGLSTQTDLESGNFSIDHHAVYLRNNMEQLTIQWIKKTSIDSRLILLSDKACISLGRKLMVKFPQIKKILLVPDDFLHFQKANENFFSYLKDSELTSIIIPSPVVHKNIQFLPGNAMPDLSQLYFLIKKFWMCGFRYFIFHSYGGAQYVPIPYFLHSFSGLHTGQRCFIVGNGPSLNQIDMSLLKNEITFGSNRCYLGFEKWGFPFNYWGVMDRLQIEKYYMEYEDNIPSEVIKFFPFEYINMFNFDNYCPVNFSYDSRPPYKFSNSPDNLFLGFTVTHMLMQIATIMGCNPIYLIGCDHNYNFHSTTRNYGLKNAEVWEEKDTKAPTHFAENYTKGEDKLFVTPKLDKAELAFQEAQKWAIKFNKQIYNATPKTGLRAFPLINYNKLF